MFDVLMYLFETYIHNEAELRVDQDRLGVISPTLGLIAKTSTMRCCGWKNSLTIRMASRNPCNLLPTLFQCAFIRLKSVKGLMPVAGVPVIP